jgi:antimicrobial peptide system SdpB family protein
MGFYLTTFLNEPADKIGNRSPFTNVYGLARSVLAFGTLNTILFNEDQVLFPIEVIRAFQLRDFISSINLFYLCGLENLLVAKVITVVVLLFVLSGYLPKVTGILHWWVSYSFFSTAPIIDGGDQITSLLTLLIVPITLLDPRVNHWDKLSSERRNEFANIFCNCIILLIQIQMCVVYFQAGVEKFKVNEWADGTAVYYWFNHNTFGTPDWLRKILNPLLIYPIIVSTLSWGAILLEIVLFGCIFMTRNRRMKLLLPGILFHFIIALVHGLISFFFAMSGGLILYLYPVEKDIDFSRLKKSVLGKINVRQLKKNYYGKTI